jgi:signal peptidase I
MRRVRSIIVWCALIGAIVVAGLMLVPSIFGFERYVIESGSMTGTIDKGSIVYSKAVPADTLKVGDIITFHPPSEFGVDGFVTHRIADINRPPEAGGFRTFRTKGDANPSADPWEMTLDNDRGALEKAHVPYVGYVYLALAVPWVRLLLITIPALLIVVLTAVSMWRDAGRQAEAERQALSQDPPPVDADETPQAPSPLWRGDRGGTEPVEDEPGDRKAPA